MRKIVILFSIFACIIGIAGCSASSENTSADVQKKNSAETSNRSQKENSQESEEKSEAGNQFVTSNVSAEGNIEINTEDITENATFINHKVDNITIQLLAVKASDGTTRIAFNTCQTCNPSPQAYFVQQGDEFVCHNCGTRFSTDDIGVAGGGCNPAVVGEATESDGKIIIPVDYLESFKNNFTYWSGPVE